MKTILFYAALCVVLFACEQGMHPSKTPIANTEVIRNDSIKLLLGHCSRTVLLKPPYSKWFVQNYEAYQPTDSVMTQLTGQLKNIRLEIFLGSWCGDSKREVPRFLKILDKCGVDTNSVKLIFVDNRTEAYKQSPQHEERGKHIFKVPTFLVYKNTHLIGRIVETPVVSLEKDLLDVVMHQAYIPNYKGVDYWIKSQKNNASILPTEKLTQTVQQLKPITKNAGEFNAYGYSLLSAKKYKEAQNIFILNTLLYPLDANVWDSLGEFFETIKDTPNALLNYNKALELDPNNAVLKSKIESLK